MRQPLEATTARSSNTAAEKAPTGQVRYAPRSMGDGRYIPTVSLPRRHARRMLAIVAVLIAALACALPAAAWSPPQQLSSDGQVVNQIERVVAGPEGSVATLWYAAGTYYTAKRATAGGFAAPVAVNPEPLSNDQSSDIAIGPDGAITAVWIDSSNDTVQTATTLPGSVTYGAPQIVYREPDGNVFGAVLAIASDGTVVVSWLSDRNDNPNYVVSTATRTPGAAAFGTSVDLSNPEQDSDGATVVAAPDNSITIMWYGFVGGNVIIEAATRPAGSSSFGPVRAVTTQRGTNRAETRSAVTGDGTLIVAWVDGDRTLATATRPAGATAFGPAEVLSDPTESVDRFALAAAPDGTAVIIWDRPLSPGYAVSAAIRSAGAAAFGAPQVLSRDGTLGLTPVVAVAPDGRFTGVWTEAPMGPGQYNLRSATLAPGTAAFTDTETIAETQREAVLPRLATASDGTPVVAWEQTISGTTSALASWGSPTTYPLTIGRSGTGTGTVTPATTGRVCSETCTATYTLSTRVTLTAKPTRGSAFAGWTGACTGTSTTCTVSVLGARTATARFAATAPGKVRLARSRLAGQATIALWQAPGRTGGARTTHYQTRIRSKGGTWSNWTTQQRIAGRPWQSHAFRGLEQGQAYAVQIRGQNTAGTGQTVLTSFVTPRAAASTTPASR